MGGLLSRASNYLSLAHISHDALEQAVAFSMDLAHQNLWPCTARRLAVMYLILLQPCLLPWKNKLDT